MSNCLVETPCTPNALISTVDLLCVVISATSDCPVKARKEIRWGPTCTLPVTTVALYFDSITGADITALVIKEVVCPQKVEICGVTPPIIIPPPTPLVPIPVDALTCGGATISVPVSQTVQTVPHKDGVQKVEICNALPPLKIQFSETKLYSASSELGLFRIREYSEATGLWALRYENLDGTPFTGTLPTDLTSVTAQVNVTRSAVLGCAASVPYYMRETARFDAETGALESELVDWVDSAGVVTATAPAGFALGACPAAQKLVLNSVHWGDAGSCVEGKAWYSDITGELVKVTTLDGVVVTVDATTLKEGACPVTIPERKVLIYLERNGGVVSMADIVAAAGVNKVQSVTVKQISGTGSVAGDSGSGVPLSPGETWSWSAITGADFWDYIGGSSLVLNAGSGEQRITATYIP